MSLRHAMLGLLTKQPASGYDLAKTFESSLGRFAWHARHSQIYPELKRLADEGLIEIVGEGPRGRKTYLVTDAGRAEFTDWMMRVPDDTVRNEFTLRLFLVPSLEREQAKALLRRYAGEAQQQLTQLKEFLAEHEPDWLTDPLDHGHLAADFGLRTLGVIHDWATAALERIEAGERAGGRTRSGG